MLPHGLRLKEPLTSKSDSWPARAAFLVTSMPEWVLTMTPGLHGAAPVRALFLYIARLLRNQLLLPDKAAAQSVMETSTLQALTPAGHGHCQTNNPQSLIPQRRLRH